MKVKDLFERYGNTQDVGFEYELEYTTPAGDIDYKMVNVVGTVTVTTDAFGTGDSPTDYEFEVDSITDQETGTPIPQGAIPKDQWEKIETVGVEKAQRGM